MTETATIGTEGDNFWADWEYQKTITENIYTVCADISSNFIQVYTEDVRNNDAWLTVNIPSDFEDNFDDINSARDLIIDNNFKWEKHRNFLKSKCRYLII
jgi:hypothetical protein